MPILDHLGRPVDLTTLEEELASPDVQGVRNPWLTSVASGLTPETLGQILAAVDANNPEEYLTLAEEMEERDLHYHAVLSTRKLAIHGLPVRVEAVSDEDRDVRAADLVRSVVEEESFSDLVIDLLDGLGKGFSVIEIMWDRSGKEWVPDRYEHRDARFFQFDQRTGREIRLRDPANISEGIPLAPYKFAVHVPHVKTGLPIRSGLARLAAVAYMCKGYSLKDWLTFAEVYGMPIRVGKFSSSASPDQKRALLRAVTNIGTDAAAIIPDTMMIDFISSSATGSEKVFQGLADWLDAQVSKGVLGQTMTTDNGSSLSQAQVHNTVREDIRDSDARQLAATIRRYVVRPLVDLNFGPPKGGKYPRVLIEADYPEDLESLSRSLPPFIDLGLRVEESVIRDKFGLPDPDEDAVLLGRKPVPAPSPFGGSPFGGSPFGGSPFGGAPGRPETPVEDEEGDEEDLENETPGTPPVEEELEDETPETLRRLRRVALAELTRKVVRGETLTEDQRAFLALAAKQPVDEIDRVTDQKVSDWGRVMDPILEPILRLARVAKDPDEFEEGLRDMNLDTRELQNTVATLAFQARGLGDATDEVTP